MTTISDKINEVTLDFTTHLLIIAKHEKVAIKYELSLLGILVALAVISLLRQGPMKNDFFEYYDAIASNYPEKLPLIFGKWELLKNNFNFSFFPSIFDFLFIKRSEILSLPILLEGNKEIYDNIKALTLSTANKFFEIYEGASSALQSDYDTEFSNNAYHELIQDKLKEIEVLLKYADVRSFAEYMRNRSSSSNDIRDSVYEEELPVIEDALAEEFTILFYVGLLRDNNHVASDYPLTTGFIRSHPNIAYPKMFLMDIIHKDAEVRNKVGVWIKATIDYQKQSLDKMSEFYNEISQYHKIPR